MRKLRKIGVLLLALIISLSFTVPAFADEKEFTVHAKAPIAWEEPGLWAWSAPDGTNVFTAWPGEKLTKDDANEGWFYYTIPTWANSIIINEGVDGGGQTADVSIESKELWITVADDFSTTVVYEAPEGFTVAAADAPKTGEIASSGLWLGMAAISGLGFIALKRKKTV